MSREWRLYLDDMADACRKIAKYSEDVPFSEFEAHGLVYDAVIRNLELLGEAAKNVPGEIRQKHPEVSWRQIAGLRDVLAHQYFGLEDETLWDVVRQQLPRLLTNIERIRALPEEPV